MPSNSNVRGTRKQGAKKPSTRGAKKKKATVVDVPLSADSAPKKRQTKSKTTAKKAKAPAAKKATAKKASSTKSSTAKRRATTAKKASTTTKKAAAKTTAKKRTVKTKAPAKAKASTTRAAKKTTTTGKKKQAASKTEKQENTEQDYLKTPSPEALAAFRRAGERRRKMLAKAKKKPRGKSKFLAKPPRKGKKYSLDLRIHSPGSNGYFSTGGVEPGAAVVRLASVKELDVIAITDYCNASYIDIIQENAKKSKVSVVPGFTMHCQVGGCDDACLLVLFPEEYAGADVYRVLGELNVPQEAYGNGDYTIDMPFTEVLEIIERNDGIIIPSGLDKTPHRKSAIPTLVEEFGIHAFDLVYPDKLDYFEERWPGGEFTFFSFSNANALAQIGNRVANVKMEQPGFPGIKQLVARRPEGISAE